MKKSPIMLIAMFGLFLSQAFSTCRCGMDMQSQESSCCHSGWVKVSAADTKAPCCNRIVLREASLNDSLASPFLISHASHALPPNNSISNVAQGDLPRLSSVAQATCQPRAPPAA